jgi:hypothetical protein
LAKNPKQRREPGAARLKKEKILVPNARTLGYSVLYRFNLDHKPKWIIGLDVGHGIPIETAEDFDAWVRGARAELSDGGTPPPDVTYQKIVDLARQIRNH